MSAVKQDIKRAVRDSKGRFVPGVPGPGVSPGRPAVIKPVRELARQHTEAAIKALAAIMDNPMAHDSARVAAIKELLDRGEGKVTQSIDTPSDGTLAGLLNLLTGGQHVLARLRAEDDDGSH